METNATKINALLDAIGQGIDQQAKLADMAMSALEKMKPTAEEYKDANLRFAAHTYAACYLTHIQCVVMSKLDIKTAENIIRFHHHQQLTIGNFADGRDVSVAQETIAAILGSYIERFFN